MLAAAGNDYPDKNANQYPLAYESDFSAIQSNKKAIRRIKFQDTDDNKADTQEADFSANDISGIFPHCVADGEWGVMSDQDEYEALVSEIQTIRYTIPRYYATYCSSETAEILTNILSSIDIAISSDDTDTRLQTLSTLRTELETSIANLVFKSDSKVPQIYIATDNKNGNGKSYGTSLTKSIGYVSAQLTCVGTDGKIMASDFSWDSQIKVRGNSTATPAKKPYNMKFNKKVDLFGFGKAKKWVLLADYFDPTLMRNKICLDLAKNLGLEATTDNQRVEVWVDGSYRGMYLLTEKIEDDKNRVDIDTDNGDFLLEIEAESRKEAGNVYIKASSGRFFRLREPEDEAQVDTIKSKIDEFENVLKTGTWEQISNYINLESFVSYYILNEFMKTIDFSGLSVFFYYKDGKFYGGPAWDFDRSSGNGSSGYGSIRLDSEGLYASTCHYYSYLFKFPEFRLAVLRKLLEVYSDNSFKAIYSDDVGIIDTEAKFYSDAIKREETVWAITLSRGMRQQEETYEGNVDFLKTWLASRDIWMENYFFERKYDESDGKYYYSYLNALTTPSFIEVNDEYYYIGAGGKIENGNFTFNGNSYYSDENGKIILQSYDVAIIGDENLDVAVIGDENLTVKVEENTSLTLSAIVSRNYGAGLVKFVSPDEYSLSWSTASSDIATYGITFANGIFSLSDSAVVGTYNIPVTANVSIGNVTVSSDKLVKITVNNIAPELGSSAATITATKGHQIQSVTITATHGVQNLTWNINKSLPTGLTYSTSNNCFVISGTPEISAATGSSSYTITASNGVGSVSVKISITIKEAKPIISGNNFELTAYKGVPVSLIVNAIEGTNLEWHLDGKLPDGLRFTSSDNSAGITGTPHAGTSGNYECEIIASNSEGLASADVKITVTGGNENSEDFDNGTASELVTRTDSVGNSVAETQTLFKNGAGEIISSVDVAIVTESSEFSRTAGIEFSTLVSVDVKLDVNDPDYDLYNYSLDIIALPDWLKISGELVSNDEIETSADYHHVFTLTGTPRSLQASRNITFAATVKISGDVPILVAYVSRDVRISVNNALLVAMDAVLSCNSLTVTMGETASIEPIFERYRALQ